MSNTDERTQACAAGSPTGDVIREALAHIVSGPPDNGVSHRRALDAVAVLEHAIRAALDELGVPGPGYLQPVTNAVEILTAALNGSEAA